MIKTGDTFPSKSDQERLQDYKIYEDLLEAEHFEAFKISSDDYGGKKDYAKLRFIAANFCGLVAKVSADMLFGEEVQIKAKQNSEWLRALWFNNKMSTQLYESSLTAASKGDAVFRVRVENSELMIEEIDPCIYFPDIQNSTSKFQPDIERLIWVESRGTDNKPEDFLVIEEYAPRSVKTLIFTLDNNKKVGDPVSIDVYNTRFDTNYQAEVVTGIDQNLIVFIPNYRMSNDFFGTSDFQDIFHLNFALDSRLTKIDNILDKHSDPILAVPEGVLDEEGKVKKSALGMVEVPSSDPNGKPEYIVWNANLDSAFKEIDKLVDFMFMMSETSPDILGLSKDGTQAESGRALKMRLLRSIAKRNRKRLYYQQGIKELLQIVQKLAVANGYMVDGKKIKEVEVVDLKWSDGIVVDEVEVLQNETTKLDAGLTSKLRAIMTVENVSEEEAKTILAEVEADDAKTGFLPPWETIPAKVNQGNGNMNSNDTPTTNADPVNPDV